MVASQIEHPLFSPRSFAEWLERIGGEICTPEPSSRPCRAFRRETGQGWPKATRQGLALTAFGDEGRGESEDGAAVQIGMYLGGSEQSGQAVRPVKAQQASCVGSAPTTLAGRSVASPVHPLKAGAEKWPPIERIVYSKTLSLF